VVTYILSSCFIWLHYAEKWFFLFYDRRRL